LGDEHGPDACAVPARPALTGRHAAGLKLARDRGERVAGLVGGHDPLGDFERERGAPAELDPGRLLRGQAVAGALSDDASLVLREGGQNVGHHLPARRRGVDAQVERHERPPLTLRGGHRLREVDQRPREPVEL